MSVRIEGTSAHAHRKAGERLLKTGAITFCCVLFGAAVAFGTTLVVSNTLGESGAGIFFQLVAYFAIATAVATFGADTGLVRTVSAALALGRQRIVGRVLATACIPVGAASLLVGGLLWLAADVQEVLPGGPDGWVSDGVRLAVLCLPASALLTAVFGALRGFHAVVTFTVLQNIVLPSLRLAGILLVLALGAGLTHLVTAWTVPILAAAVLGVVALRREMRRSRAGQTAGQTAGEPAGYMAGQTKDRMKAEGMETVRGFWAFSGARGASSVVEVLLEWVDVIAVFILLGPAAGGIYGAVSRCVRLGAMLDHSVRMVTGPVISSALATGDVASARQVFSAATRLLILGAWPFYLLLIIFGPAVMSVFGPGFESGAPALIIIGAAMLLSVSAGGVQSVLLMGGHSSWQLLNKTAALAVAVPLNLTLIPVWGIAGAATAWAAAVLVDCSLAAFQVGTVMKIAAPWRSLVLPAALALAVFGVGGLLARLHFGPSWEGLLVAAGVGAAVYAGALALLHRLGRITFRP
ncbi:lipopolysaccharide biosynthesis protein [Arthrobacter globiformis]|uniref:lipopolysaccharide biosynthesis protein n=1 Tax=Arthrobacter globiformis TaxID=1665 RepID=UPI000B41B15D|nr:polysaccharide biosynthesis C-terminal domain-containing protein [Arthrobacter globiformis]